MPYENKEKTILEEGNALEERVGVESREARPDSSASGLPGDGAVDAQASRGLSNTPATAPKQNPDQKICGAKTSIDWIRLRFNGEFKPSPSKDWIWRPLFDALHIDPMLFEEGKGFDGYSRGYQYGVNIYVSAGGGRNKNKKKDETFIIDLSGQGCREFEGFIERDHRYDDFGEDPESYFDNLYFEGWSQFLHTAIELGGICTRIDIPTDEFGTLPFEELKDKIENHIFTSSLKKLYTDKSSKYKGDDEFDTLPTHYIKGEKAGWTATLGTNSSYKIVIYDKIEETRVHHPHWTLNCSQWVRFEVRFFHEKAEECMRKLTKAYEKGPMEVHRFIIGVLASLLDIKEKLVDKKHMNRVETWKPWEEFLAEGTEYIAHPPVKDHRTLKKNAMWLKDDAARALFRLCATYKANLKEILAYLVLEGLNRADNSDLFIINEHLVDEGKPTFDAITQAQGDVFNIVGIDPSDISEEVCKLFEES
ncbi:MAG: replication initiation factor domain-containing protein [Bacilli bacterium]|nr:replication initiation factor domain-containing protein [Bacilli bacterium]